jgi:thiol-disulfide isomerase/thioredoxin
MQIKLVVLSLILIAFSGCNTKTKEDSKNQIVPSVSKDVVKESLFQHLDGKAIELSDYKGKRIVLNYWATWCVPCIKEMPSLLKAQEILEKEDYVFLLASDESVEKIENFISKYKFDFSFIKFNGSLSEQKIYALPTTFIYNTKGEKADEIIGAVEWDSKEIIEKLKNIE